MAKSQNDLVAAAQTLARLQQKRERLIERQNAQIAAIDEDINTVKQVLRDALPQ
jgi:hypothetical protein